MKKILWLASWYPNDLAPLNADFIQRHARAVSLYHEVDTIFVVRDREGKITRKVKYDTIEEGALTQHIIYYYSPARSLAVIDRFLSQLRYQKLFKRSIRDYIRKKGKPALVHVHVGMKAGLLAKWMKTNYPVPYVITEHWTGFLPEAAERFDQLSFYLKRQWRKLLSGAAGISVVSSYLGQHLENLPVKKPAVIVIPNVVDTSIFYPLQQTAQGIPHFIHVSGLGFQKNPEAIIDAFAIVKKKTSSFQLTIFGPANKTLRSKITELGLQEQVDWREEVPQPQLAAIVQQADALVLYSRYETFGCVVIEAQASGVPVIVSDIPVMHELVQDGKNGIFAKGENAEALAEKISWMIEHKNDFNKRSIAEEATVKYNYARVGKMFADWYADVLSGL